MVIKCANRVGYDDQNVQTFEPQIMLLCSEMSKRHGDIFVDGGSNVAGGR